MRWLAMGALLLLSDPGHAAYWEYNGSRFRLEANGPNRSFYYETVRAGLPVSPGTLVFQGRRSGNRYTGTAYVFSSRCGPIGYEVSGTVSPDQRSVTLRGRVPVRDAACRVTAHQDNTLTFTYHDGDETTRIAKGGSSKRLVVGKDISLLHGQAAVELHGQTFYIDGFDSDEATEEFWHDAEMVVNLSGLSPNPFLVRRSTGVRNGFAGIGTRDNGRYIIYDAQWYNGETTGSKYLVLGHEIGHHVCGHQSHRRPTDNWAVELEADRYAGSVLRRLDHVSVHEEIAKHRTISPVEGSATHPPRALREAAILQGYYNGSPCQNFGYVKPLEFTEADKAEFHKQTRNFCMGLVRAWCESRDANAKLWTHILMSSNNCGIPPATLSSAAIRDVPPDGTDCQGGGRFTAGPFRD